MQGGRQRDGRKALPFPAMVHPMHVMVLGAGVTGVTTAWYLAEAGFRVSVIDRQPAAGLETSFANGGQISLSHPEPWSNPSAPFNALRWLGQPDAPLRFHLRAQPSPIAWSLAFLGQCLPHRFRRNARAVAILAAHSGRCLRALRERTGLDYEQRTRGILHLLHTTAALRQSQVKLEMLSAHGIRARLCTPGECGEIDPALQSLVPGLAGGLYAPDDESGNALLFTQGLVERARVAGVTFRFGLQVEALHAVEGHLRGVRVRADDGTEGQLGADAYVLCLGSHGARLTARLGLHLPIYPVKGYSVSLAIRDAKRAPEVSLTDEARRIVCSRLGDRLRVAGTAEIGGFDTSIDERRCRQLIDWAEQSFPGALDPTAPSPWAGLRPVTPSNVPIIGRSSYPELWLNTGHGSLGWTLACGSAHLLSELLCGKPTPVPGFPLYGKTGA